MEHTPSGGADTGTAVGEDGGPLSIGAVLRVLRDEFPQVTVSKIRFLEAEGLVEPRRSPSGYRKFSVKDVERLTYILRMQRDHYLPLRVIGERLDALTDERRPSVPAQTTPRGQLGQGSTEPTSIRRAELLAATDVSDAELTEWESHGLLTPDREGSYDIDAVTVARLLADLGRSGLNPSSLQALKTAADREADMVNTAVARLTEQENSRAAADADTAARRLATLSAQLHAALVLTALRLRSC